MTSNNTPTILHTNKYGIRIVRIDSKHRTKIRVESADGKTVYRIYRCYSLPFYEHQYLSWANLDCCNGWKHDESYLYTAVQNNLKLVSGISITDVTEKPVDENKIRLSIEQLIHPYDKSREDYYITNMRENGPYRFINVEIIRRGTLADFYDIDEIVDVYKTHDILVDINTLYIYFKVELSDLFTEKFNEYEYPNPSTLVECIVTGLGLGYPIESTVGFIQG